MKSELSWRRLWKPVVLLLVCGLASCGGGSVVTAGGVGTGGTGSAYGTVTGFGSVIVDGTTYSSATPRYLAGTETAEASEVTSTAVELGAQLEMQLDAQGNPSTVLIEPDLIGAVADVRTDTSGSSFSVNGVLVRVNADQATAPLTYYQGLPNFLGLVNGMQVEVHGVYGVDNGGQSYFQATLVEQLPASNLVTRISGIVTNLDTGAGSFQIGGTTVQFGSQTNLLPAATALANGQWVNVWSNAPHIGNTVVAGAIRVRTLQGISGPVQLAGLVSGLGGDRFAVSGLTVDASAPGLATTVQALTVGEYVVVQGQSTPATGVVVASAIRVYTAQSNPVEVRGTINGFVSPGNFTVRGVVINASSAAFQGDASSQSLADGAYVDIIGSIDGNTLIAASVSVPGSVPEGATVDYPGTVSGYDPTNGRFVLTLANGTAVSVTLASNVAYGNGKAGDLVNGAAVDVSASSTASGLLAYSVEFRSLAIAGAGANGSSPLEASGLAYGVTPTGVMLNGLALQISPSTTVVGTLADGVSVEVQFIVSGGQNLAQTISVDD